jgi:hypothetical protein
MRVNSISCGMAASYTPDKPEDISPCVLKNYSGITYAEYSIEDYRVLFKFRCCALKCLIVTLLKSQTIVITNGIIFKDRSEVSVWERIIIPSGSLEVRELALKNAPS